MAIRKLFPTHLYLKELLKKDAQLVRELLKESYKIRNHDAEGQKWSKKNYPGGYTSYSSLSELYKMSSTFEALKKRLDREILSFAKDLDMDTKNYKLEITNLWINIVPPKTYHALHLHPLSTLSGTIYLQVPKNSGQIKFEDPRLSNFMGSLPRTHEAAEENKRFIFLDPKVGQLALWESWLRHEVLQNQSSEDRVSLSFNYNWF